MVKAYHLFAIKDHFYIFDYRYLAIFEIGEELFYLILQYEKKSYQEFYECIKNSSIKFSDQILEIIDEGFLFCDEDEWKQENKYNMQSATDQEINLTISLGKRCNLGCEYCFLKGVEADEHDLLLDNLEIQVKFLSDKYKKISLIISNEGEAFLYKTNIRLICNLLKKMQDNNNPISLTVVTNGTIYDKEILDWLSSIDAILVYSIDGQKKDHDKSRKFKSGAGTFETVRKNLISILKDDSLSRITRNIWTSSIVSLNTSSIVANLKELREIGCKTVQFKLVKGMTSSVGINSITLPHFLNLYKELFAFLEENIFENVADYFMMILNNGDSVGGLMMLLLLEESRYKCCYGTTQTLCLNNEGVFFPCLFFNHNKAYSLGRDIGQAFISNTNSFFSNLTIFSYKKCSQCWARTICGGPCPYHSLQACNDINLPDENMCQITQFIIEHLIHIINIMETNNLPLYKKLISYCEKRRAWESIQI